MNMVDVVSQRTLTPTKRPHMVDVMSQEKLSNFTIPSDLSEPDTKRRKNIINDKEERITGLRETWCDKHFVVSKLEGHNDVICSLDCNQDLLLTGRYL